MKETLTVLLFIVILGWAVFDPAVYALAAHKMARDREPFLTTIMILGLAVSCYVTSLVSGASVKLCFWTFAIATLWFLIFCRLFGKGSYFEMFMGPHVLVVLTILLLPTLQNARIKTQQLNRQYQQYETAHQK
jgi:hypothetical protein